MQQIIIRLRAELKALADETIRLSSQRFFKEEIKCYGSKTATVVKIGKEYFKEIKHLSKSEIFALCEELWKDGYLEETFIACNWSFFVHKNYEPSDIKIFKNWIEKYINNWASCDTFCNHTVGEFVEMFPDKIKELKKWAKSDNRWMKRAAAVTLIIPARKGKFKEDILEIAELLLLDKDDMVQKGYGWMLKAASEADRKMVYNFVIKHKAVMPRTALRYAIEKMPQELRKKAMEK
ncbi:MAG: DNA alkylation repair protein [Bacteroidales bacterium]|nr:DNA alkylation repair protein [Bacteroidales bacterium]